MKLVSFNVNSVRLRIPQLQALIETHSPEVIGLQETKVTDQDFPVEDIEKLGYHVEYCGQKTHYGVAIMSKTPALEVRKGFPSDDDDAQKRLIAINLKTSTDKKLSVINGYFPQGENREHPVKFPAKEKFYSDLLTLLNAEYSNAANLVVMGDFNVSPVDNDIGIGADNAKRWLRSGATSFLPEEREWLQKIEDWGLVDTFRQKYPDEDQLFSWFDYRSKGFDRDPKRGLRIDHILATKKLAAKLDDSGSDYKIRAMEKPSDHCPVWSSFDL